MTVTELINTETGEVITAKSARESVHRARGNVAGFWREVQWQVTNRAWEVLGYDTFDDLWTDQYAAFEVSIPRALRPELTASLRSAGQTQQQIADKLGVSQRTVSGDLNSNSANEPEPTKITNSRGQERPASYQRPEPRLRSRPAPRTEAPPPNSPEAKRDDSRWILRRVVNLIAFADKPLDPDQWADNLGEDDAELAELIKGAEVSARVLLALVDRKRS